MEMLPKYSNEPNFVGYPLWYVIDDRKAQCNECATVSKSEGFTTSKQVNWEDTNLWCDECSEKIESAEVKVNFEDTNLWCDECSEKIESAYAEDEDDNTDDFDEPYIRGKDGIQET